MKRYFFARHVYACLVDDFAVMLDLRANKYIGLRADQHSALNVLIPGWASCDGQAIPDSALLQDAERTLLSQGLITDDATRANTRTPVSIDRTDRTLTRRYIDPRPHIRVRDRARFLLSWARVSLAMKLHPLNRVFERFAIRNACRRVPAASFPYERARECTRIFERLRPFLFTERDACLFDSLMLADFLARYEIFPDIVIGVQTGPFAAHSWVQKGNVLFNEDVDMIQGFTPILVV